MGRRPFENELVAVVDDMNTTTGERRYFHGGVEVSADEAAELVEGGAHYGRPQDSFPLEVFGIPATSDKVG